MGETYSVYCKKCNEKLIIAERHGDHFNCLTGTNEKLPAFIKAHTDGCDRLHGEKNIEFIFDDEFDYPDNLSWFCDKELSAGGGKDA